jgi:hypothetical protein
MLTFSTDSAGERNEWDTVLRHATH